MVNVARSVSYTDVSTPLEVDATPNTNGTLSPEDLLPQLELDWYPEVLMNMAGTVATSHQVLDSMAILSCIQTGNGCVVGKYESNPLSWSEEHSSLYTMMFAPSGGRKSAVFKQITKPIETWERLKTRQMETEYNTALTAFKMAEDELKRVIRSAQRGDEDAQAEVAGGDLQRAVDEAERAIPVLPRLLIQDATPEAMELRMMQHHERLFSCDAEGTAFNNMTGLRWDNPASFAAYLKAYSGDRLQVDRVGTGSRHRLVLENPALSVLWMAQPSFIDVIAKQKALHDQGLYARFLMMVFPSNKKNLVRSGLVEGLRKDYADAWRDVLYLMLEAEHDGEDETGVTQSHVIPLSAKAHDVAQDYEAYLIERIQDDQELEEIEAWASKAHGMAIRIAVTLQLIDRASQLVRDDKPARDLWNCEIGERWMQSAVSTMEVIEQHCLYIMSDRRKQDADATYVLGVIEKETKKAGGTITRRLLLRRVIKRLRHKHLLEPLVAQLEERGAITTNQGENGTVYINRT